MSMHTHDQEDSEDKTKWADAVFSDAPGQQDTDAPGQQDTEPDEDSDKGPMALFLAGLQFLAGVTGIYPVFTSPPEPAAQPRVTVVQNKPIDKEELTRTLLTGLRHDSDTETDWQTAHIELVKNLVELAVALVSLQSLVEQRKLKAGSQQAGLGESPTEAGRRNIGGSQPLSRVGKQVEAAATGRTSSPHDLDWYDRADKRVPTQWIMTQGTQVESVTKTVIEAREAASHGVEEYERIEARAQAILDETFATLYPDVPDSMRPTLLNSFLMYRRQWY